MVNANPSKYGKIVLFILCILFTVPFVLLCVFLSRDIKKENLAKSGETVIATVTDYKSYVEINEIPYYAVYYVFMGKDGNLYTGKTDSHYLYEEARGFYESGVIELAVDENYNAVRKDFEFEFDFTYIILVVFCSIDAVLWIVLIIKSVGDKNKNNILEKGEKRLATFISAKSPYSINDIPKYYIKFGYQGSDGVKREVKTRAVYTGDEVFAYQTAKEFYIKVLNGKCAIIPLNYTESERIPPIPHTPYAGDFMTDNGAGKTKDKYSTCPFCGKPVKSDETRCPYCGAGLTGFLD